MLCTVGHVTVLRTFGNGMNGSMVTSWDWCILHHNAVLSSPKEQGEREDPEPDSFTAVVWSDCSGSSRKNHQMTCVIFQQEDFGGQLVWALQSYVAINIEGNRILSKAMQ